MSTLPSQDTIRRSHLSVGDMGLSTGHQNLLPVAAGVHIIPDLTSGRPSSVVTASRHHGFSSSGRYHKGNHCPLFEGAVCGASLREVVEENEDSGGELMLNSGINEGEQKYGRSDCHLAAHSFSVINCQKDKEEELFDNDNCEGSPVENRRSLKTPVNSTDHSLRCLAKDCSADISAEEAASNQKSSACLAVNVPIPEDKGKFCTTYREAFESFNHSMSCDNRHHDAYPPSQTPQVVSSSNSTSVAYHHPHESRRGNPDSRTVISVGDDPAGQSLPGVAAKRPDCCGGGAASVTGVSIVSARSMIQGSVITFRDVEYIVPVKKNPCSRAVKKVVLDGVSGIMRPGLNAIMGPTGCGKSSLLDVLAGRKDPRFLTGEVLVDGHPQPKNFKCISGYVVQDDILMGTLTVRETLYLAAALRRKQGSTKVETHEKINEILDELGLMKIADNKIGTELIRGISGGERKRTSIGMEIIADPSVLFLDEPTTGLDAFTAGSVIQTLKSLSRRGRTIVLSIHQPKYSIYKLFDSLTLMASGRIVYHGPARKEPIQYFSKLGYRCEDHNNPPDFFLDILHGEIKPADSTRDKGDEFDAQSDDSFERMRIVSERLVSLWTDSTECQNIRNEVLAVANRSSNATNYSNPPDGIGYAASFPLQLLIVCWRTFIGLLRDPQASIVQTLVYLFFAISMGVVYFGLDTSLESGLQNRSGLFFFATLQVVFVNIGSIELFLKERALFIHEHSSGYYRVCAYFLAKLICDVFPTKALPVFFFMPITYWMAGLVPQVGNFFFFELILTLGTISASAAAMAVSASVTLFSIANVIISILFVFMMVFGGFLINLNSMPPWLSWLRYFSIFHYTFGGLLVNELTNLEFCPTANKTSPTFNDTRKCELGRLYLDNYGYASQTTWDMWSNVVGLSGIAIVCFILCYCLLRRINTFK
ncbi:unnamed protein product [Mesocestoides corti]|uniref:ABC transporter domain-containing protein n=1 Tax=Mesocestoides corti TaxID=53468 RepID=A0A0R3UMC2_MESCO|nr:unnamed protein product [Mesocestoides corti]